MAERRIVLDVLKGETACPPPVWMMRQAGRYLPEYRATRASAGSFLDLCYNPDLAVEVTMQPIRRFDFDASILFSDILVVPHALGRDLRFEEGRGPLMTPIEPREVARLADIGDDAFHVNLEPVYETVRRLRAELPARTTLLGFCGAPWTVATYMLQGRGGDKDEARRAIYQRPQEMDALLAALVETTAQHLAAQVRAGADCLQLFESWAEGLPPQAFQRVVIHPTRKLVRRLRELGVGAPIIGFPRGAGAQIAAYANETGVNALGVDTQTPAQFAYDVAPEGMPLQGNLDPQTLVVGGEALERAARDVLIAFKSAPHIFNLGHGITPDATPENVARLVQVVKGGV